MTMLLLRILLILLCGNAALARAGGADAPIEVMADGRKYCSMDEYARSKAGVDDMTPDPAALVEARSSGPQVAGVTPSLAEIVREFQGSALAGEPLGTPLGLAQALAYSARGRQGPLLVVADVRKLRIMELK